MLLLSFFWSLQFAPFIIRSQPGISLVSCAVFAASSNPDMLRFCHVVYRHDTRPCTLEERPSSSDYSDLWLLGLLPVATLRSKAGKHPAVADP